MKPSPSTSSLALWTDAAIACTPTIRVENGLASVSASVHQDVERLLASSARTVMVIGTEKMTRARVAVVKVALMSRDYESARKESTAGLASQKGCPWLASHLAVNTGCSNLALS